MSEVVKITDQEDGPTTLEPGEMWPVVVNYFRNKHPYRADPLGRIVGYAAAAHGLPIRDTAEVFAAAAEPPIVGVELTHFCSAATEPNELTGMINRALTAEGGIIR